MNLFVAIIVEHHQATNSSATTKGLKTTSTLGDQLHRVRLAVARCWAQSCEGDEYGTHPYLQG